MKLLTIHITINPQAKGCDSFTLFIRLLKSKRVQYILTRIVLMVDQVSTYINYSVYIIAKFRKIDSFTTEIGVIF